jgi:hypothetical protein
VAKKKNREPAPAYKVGDRVSFPFGSDEADGVIVEDRGCLGIGGRRLYGIRFELNPGDFRYVELPEVEMAPFSSSPANGTIERAQVCGEDVKKYRGHVYYEAREASGAVTDAVISRNRISVDWREDGDDYHLEASAPDGFCFRGDYADRGQASRGQFELKLYRGGDEVLLRGSWSEPAVGKGDWTFLLTPVPNNA